MRNNNASRRLIPYWKVLGNENYFTNVTVWKIKIDYA